MSGVDHEMRERVLAQARDIHWLSAKATWSVPPITPSQLEEVRTHVTVLLDILGPR